MQPWPLEKIPCLDAWALTAILQSITRTVLGRHESLPLSAVEPSLFAARSWEGMGCGSEDLVEIARCFAAMFNVPPTVPAAEETAGGLAERTLTSWRRSGSLVTFFTSGSTGKPKPCTHPEEHLRQEMTALAPLAAGCRAVLASAPLQHMYGFTYGLMLSLTLGVPLRIQPSLPTVLAAQMRPGDLVVSIPLLWTRLAELVREGMALDGSDITLVTGSSPTPPEVIHTLTGSGFRMLEFFGASETGVMCWRADPEDPFALFPYFRRADTGRDQELERVLPDGTSLWYPLLDRITWVDARRLFPRGRRDSAVQVGSVNVFPRRVAEVLARHEGVRECSVRLMRSEEGERLKAFVVPALGWEENDLRAALLTFARVALNDAERPARYAFGEDLPRSPLGKPVDW